MREYHALCDQAVKHFGIDIRKDRSRKAEPVRIRHAIGKILSVKDGFTLTEIGKVMGLDHTIIVYCRSMHASRYRSDERYAKVHDILEMHEHPNEESLNDIIKLIREIP